MQGAEPGETSAMTRRCPVCGATLDGRRADAEVGGPVCRRERGRLRALLAGRGNGPYHSVAEYQARRPQREREKTFGS